jgi:hypothetical protein
MPDRVVQHATMDMLYGGLRAVRRSGQSFLMGGSCYDVGNVYNPAHAMVWRIAEK